MRYPAVLKRHICSEATLAQICSSLMSASAVLVMVLGIRSLVNLDLSESEVQMSAAAVMRLSGMFVALAFVMKLWRRQALGLGSA